MNHFCVIKMFEKTSKNQNSLDAACVNSMQIKESTNKGAQLFPKRGCTQKSISTFDVSPKFGKTYNRSANGKEGY